jgi:transcription elongation GreA/GreB family factor
MCATSRNVSRARFRSLSRADTVVVVFGTQVTILRDDGRRQTFRIVGEDEADPRSGSIAYVSPLAHRLIGKRIGEAVEMDGREIELVAVE